MYGIIRAYEVYPSRSYSNREVQADKRPRSVAIGMDPLKSTKETEPSWITASLSPPLMQFRLTAFLDLRCATRALLLTEPWKRRKRKEKNITHVINGAFLTCIRYRLTQSTFFFLFLLLFSVSFSTPFRSPMNNW